MYLFCAAWLDLDLPMCNYGQNVIGIVLTDQQVNFLSSCYIHFKLLY